MPTYAFSCDNGHDFDVYLKYADYDSPQFCSCGRPGTRRICAPMVFISPEIRYDSPIDGRPITSRQARIEDLKRHNCIEYDPGMKQDSERRMKEGDAQLDHAIESTVEQQIHAMPARKREKLTAELQQGLTAEPVRLPGA